ncbi:MAG: HPr family phosphocarrier protein [Deltaproteobacteria bacterium]|nr:HPr family phosphocarrier protein [Deltaproteobacteria bacterium]
MDGHVNSNPNTDAAASAVKDFKIRNKLGLHARAASQFVQVANRFTADIFVTKNGREVNGKSIMGVLMLAAERGSLITVRAAGEDAVTAIAALGELIDAGFGED